MARGRAEGADEAVPAPFPALASINGNVEVIVLRILLALVPLLTLVREADHPAKQLKQRSSLSRPDNAPAPTGVASCSCAGMQGMKRICISIANRRKRDSGRTQKFSGVSNRRCCIFILSAK